MLKVKVDTKWMVLARHFGMPGGIWDYGTADIKEFFHDYKKACKYAEKLLKKTHKDVVDPKIWVVKCERTYQKAKEGLCYAYSEEGK